MAWDSGLDTESVTYKIASAPEPRVRVIAGPGTGKSFAMKRRVARLLETGVSPKELLASLIHEGAFAGYPAPAVPLAA